MNNEKTFSAIARIYGAKLFDGTKIAADIPLSVRADAVEYAELLQAAA